MKIVNYLLQFFMKNCLNILQDDDTEQQSKSIEVVAEEKPSVDKELNEDVIKEEPMEDGPFIPYPRGII